MKNVLPIKIKISCDSFFPLIMSHIQKGFLKIVLVWYPKMSLLKWNVLLLLFPLSGKPLGETVLFFGCRHEQEDYIYREELENYQKNEILSQLHVAFSRDGEKKVYVQDLLRQQKKYMWEILEKGGHIYVCG